MYRYSGQHGDVFLNADRRNRIEKARLDKHLRGIDKDCARHQFIIDSQKRAIVHKWHGISKTTGHSDRALPPEGPHDNIYENCKYNRSKLSEKRLMEWKVRERQLEKFLKQFQPRPWTTPGGLKPRPASSRCDRGFTGTDSSSSNNKTKTPTRRVSSAKAALQSNSQHLRKRCSSAVSFSSRTELITSHRQQDKFLTKGEKEKELLRHPDDDEDDDEDLSDPNCNSGRQMFRSHLRSFSLSSVHCLDQHKNRPVKNRHHASEKSNASDFLEKSNPPLGTTLNETEVAEQLKSSTKNYEAFVRANSISETKFFVTKDNVVMTNAGQQTCRELRTSDQPADAAESGPGLREQHAPSIARTVDEAFSTENMSVSSVSSEELVDNVFVGSDDVLRVKPSSNEKTESAGSDIKHDFQQEVNKILDYSEDQEHQEPRDNKRSSSSFSHVKEGFVTRGDLKQIHEDLDAVQDLTHRRLNSGNVRKPSVANGHSEATISVKDSKQNIKDVHIRSVSKPLEKLTIVEHKHSQHTKDKPPNPRRPNTQPHTRSKSAVNISKSNATLDIDGDNSEPRLTKTLMMKRQQSNNALQKHHVILDTKTNASCITSAMTVTPLALKDSRQCYTVPRQQRDGSVAAESTGTTMCRPNDEAQTGSISPGHQKRNPYAFQNSIHTSHHLDDDSDDEVGPPSPVDRQPFQRRRDMDLEQPAGLRPTVSALGTVIKAAMVFSKSARKRTLTSMVDENNVDKREVVRKERLRKLQSRASVLSKIVAQFPVPGSTSD